MDLNTIMALVCPFVAAFCSLLLGLRLGERRARKQLEAEWYMARSQWLVLRNPTLPHPNTIARAAFKEWLARQN